MKKEWFPAINGWKGILAIFVLLLHSEPGFYGGQVHFETGYLAVDCFFVMSGFFLVRSLDKMKDRKEPVVTVMVSRLKKIYPLYIICLGIYLLLYAVMPQISLENIDKSAIAAEFMMLQMSGFFPFQCLNWTDWYISAMILAMPILAALHTWHKKSFYHIAAPLLILAIDCLFFQKIGSLDIHEVLLGYFRGGFLRAVSGMCWGCLAYQAYLLFAEAVDKLKKKVKYIYIYIGRGGHLCRRDPAPAYQLAP